MKLAHEEHGIIVDTDTGKQVACTFPVDGKHEPLASHICTACNHHDELVRELKKVIDYHEYVQRNCIWHLEANAQVDLVQMLNDLRSFLARIEEASRG
jgi:hypothetical protein